MINKYGNTIVLVLTVLALTAILASCEEYVNVDVPDSQLGTEIVFSDSRTAEAALTSLYSRMQASVIVTGDLTGISILMGAAADDFIYFSGGGLPEEPFHNNNLQPADPTVATLWNGGYGVIYGANAVMEGLQNSTSIPTADKERLRGEALFIRAYMHFYLQQLFGHIPYVTTTDYRVNTTIGKQDEPSLYAMEIADLLKARDLLPQEYQGANRVRPNSLTVTALLARCYLYAGNLNLALEEANVVINSGVYAMETDLERVFLRESTGTIWQLMPSAEGAPTFEAKNFIFLTAPPPVRGLTPELLNAFEAGDLRKTAWVGNVLDEIGTFYYPFKYKQNENGTTSTEYSVQLRIEEMYLIRAEAAAQSGDNAAAIADLDIIRARAGLTRTVAMTKAEILSAIIAERRVEFFSEMGQRFFDLRRSGTIDTVLSAVKLGWHPTDRLLPLPQSELLLNPNLLPQNAGF